MPFASSCLAKVDLPDPAGPHMKMTLLIATTLLRGARRQRRLPSSHRWPLPKRLLVSIAFTSTQRQPGVYRPM